MTILYVHIVTTHRRAFRAPSRNVMSSDEADAAAASAALDAVARTLPSKDALPLTLRLLDYNVRPTASAATPPLR
jgi:hypothetical protein